MSASDLAVYRGCYCESCHQLREHFGIISTAAVNYDMTFNSIILNSVSSDGLKKQNTKNGMICIFGKHADSELLRKIAGYTILLTKWELEDDKNDNPTVRSNAARIALGRAVRKAERIYPEYDEYVSKGFSKLKKMEDGGHMNAEDIGRELSSSLIPAMKDIAGDIWSEDLESLFMDLGTMIYVIDAADDLDEDYMTGSFNPFLSGCDEYVNRRTFIQKNLYEITDIINGIMADMQRSYLSVRGSMRFHYGVSDNIIYHGIPDSAKRVIAGECASKPNFRNAVSSRMMRRGGI